MTNVLVRGFIRFPSHRRHEVRDWAFSVGGLDPIRESLLRLGVDNGEVCFSAGYELLDQIDIGELELMRRLPRRSWGGKTRMNDICHVTARRDHRGD